jgi:integrase/recombinase XerD
MKKRQGRKQLLDVDLRQEVRRSIDDRREKLGFDDAIQRFLKECEMKEYSPHTIRFYLKELGHVKRHLVDVGAPLDDLESITYDQIYEIMRLLKDNGLKPMTIHARLRAIRAVFNWAVKRNLIKQSPMLDVGLPKIKHQVGATLTKPQLKRLLDAPDLSSFVGLRDYVLLLTFAHTGARVSEVADLTVQCVSFEEDAITYQRTKNGKARRIPMSKQLNKAMKAWFKVRGLDLDTDALFITQYNEPLDGRQMQKRMKYYSEETGVEKEVSVSPHCFRRTFAKIKIQNGVDVFTVQALMGHSSLDQLKQYVLLYSEDLKKGIDAGF